MGGCSEVGKRTWLQQEQNEEILRDRDKEKERGEL